MCTGRFVAVHHTCRRKALDYLFAVLSLPRESKHCRMPLVAGRESHVAQQLVIKGQEWRLHSLLMIGTAGSVTWTVHAQVRSSAQVSFPQGIAIQCSRKPVWW